MAYENNNTDWHLWHNGARCPINDTLYSGAAYALGSHESEWEDGSINKAVKTQMDVQGKEFNQEDYDSGQAGTLNMIDLIKYVDRSMLYGYKGLSKDTKPQSALAFRGYPTVTVDVESYQYEHSCNSCGRLNADGSDSGEDPDNYTNVSYKLKLSQPVSYDVLVDVRLKEASLVFNTGRYRLKIIAGDLYPTEIANYATISTFFPLTDNTAWYSAKTVSGINTITLEKDTFNYGSTVVHGFDGVYEVYYDAGDVCIPPTWIFDTVVNDSDTSGSWCYGAGGIVYMYDNPTTADRSLVPASTALKSGKLGGLNGVGIVVGQPIADGKTELDLNNCPKSTVYKDYSSPIPTYIVEGRLLRATDYVVDVIYKIASGILIGKVEMTGGWGACTPTI